MQAAAEAAAEELLGQVRPYARVLLERAPGRGPPARARPPRRPWPSSVLSPTGSASTTWWPPVGRARTVATPARSTAPSSGAGRSSQAVRRWAERERHRAWRAATRTPTATSTLPCWRRSATRSPSTPTPSPRRAWPASAAGRCVTSTCPPGVVEIAGRELQELAAPAEPAGAGAQRPLRDPGHREHPRARARAIVVVQPPQLLRLRPSINLVLAKAGRNARFLGKKEVFDIPVVGAVHHGCSVASGSTAARASDEPLEQRHRALKAGELVVDAPRRARSRAGRRSSSPS